jgi:cytochrome c oxidase subunit II
VGNKGWSILFGVVMLGCTVSYAISPWMGWGLPDGVSSHASHVDFLYYVILAFVTFFFILTEGILVYFMWAYSQSESGKRPVHEKAEFPGFLKPLTNLLHSQHHVELAWTFVPAAILIYIAVAQVNTWADIKYVSANKDAKDADGKPATRTQIAVSARQFEWRMRYPSSERFTNWMKDIKDPKIKKDYDEFATKPHNDDVHVVNELHIWKNHPVVVHLSTRDVIHSFNLPHFRVKQDALPGKQIPVWFVPIKANCQWDKKNPDSLLFGVDPNGEEKHEYNWDIPCAELCGWGHYRMIGRVYVHETQKDFLKWLELTEAANRPPMAPPKEVVTAKKKV